MAFEVMVLLSKHVMARDNVQLLADILCLEVVSLDISVLRFWLDFWVALSLCS